MISQTFLKEHLEYRDGHLWWIKKTSKYSPVCIGKQFGSLSPKGYIVGDITQRFSEHRLVWLYHHGKFPDNQLDHINGIRHDNRIENLREVTNQQNQFNQRVRSGTSSRYKGVGWCKNHGKWKAYYRFNGRNKHLGYFENEQIAALTYNNAVKDLFKEHAKLNNTVLGIKV